MPIFTQKASQRLVADEILSAAKDEMKTWLKNVKKRISIQKLETFDIQFFCVPIPSADGFRGSFLKALGIAK